MFRTSVILSLVCVATLFSQPVVSADESARFHEWDLLVECYDAGLVTESELIFILMHADAASDPHQQEIPLMTWDFDTKDQEDGFVSRDDEGHTARVCDVLVLFGPNGEVIYTSDCD